MSEDSKSAIHEIACDDVMDISTAANLKSLLVGALESGKPVILDASQVERADTAALQLLASFFHDASAQDQSIQWREPSDVLVHSSKLLGLSTTLNLESALH